MRTKAGALLVSLGMVVAVPSGIAAAQVDDGTATVEETVETTTEDTDSTLTGTDTDTDTETVDDATVDTGDTVDSDGTDATDGATDGATDTVGALDGDGTDETDEADEVAVPEVDGEPTSAPVPDDDPAPAASPPATAPASATGDTSDADVDSTVAAIEDTEVVRLLSSVVASVWGELPLDPDDPEGPDGPDGPDGPTGTQGPDGAGPSSETDGGTVGAPARQGTSIHDPLVERRESRRGASGGQAQPYHSLLGHSGADTWIRHASSGSAEHAAVGGTELAAPIGFPGSDGELDPLVKAMGSLALLLSFTGVMVELAHRRQQRGHGITPEPSS